MVHVTGALPQDIPSPPISSFHVGPLDIRFYALGYIIGITLAVLITRIPALTCHFRMSLSPSSSSPGSSSSSAFLVVL